jgi:hypothetical protein
MVKFNNNSKVEISKSHQSLSNVTNSASTRQSLRCAQPGLLLQKNFGFERCLWEEDARLSFIPVAPRQTTAMHLSPVETAARSIMINDAIRGQKFFLFNVVDLVEALDNSAKALSLEEAGVNISEANAQQQNALAIKAITANLHGIAASDFVNLQNSGLKNVLTANLMRALLLISCGENARAEQLLRKLKAIALFSVSSINNSSVKEYSYANILRRKYLEGLIAGSLVTRNPLILRFVTSRMFGRVLTSSNSLKQLIWKRSTLSLDQTAAVSRVQQGYFYTSHRLSSRDTSTSFLYFLRRLEEKYQALSQSAPEAAERLLIARNYLVSLAEERLHRQRQKNLLLTRSAWVRVIRRRAWRNLLVEALLRRAERTVEGRAAVEAVSSAISPYIMRSGERLPQHVDRFSDNDVSNNRGLKLLSPEHSNWRRTLRNQRHAFINKKLVEEDSVYSLKGYTDLFSQITGREASVFFVNALSLTRFAFQGEGKGKSSQRFLQNIDREMVSRYKYVAVYIQDFVRVSFISLFLKKPTFLAQFMALQLSKLPRNRKETKMLRFLIKVVKIFAAQRREVVGLRVLFKGRVNRWRRTKQVIGEKGILPLQSLNSRIEFGFAKAVTRKGTLGIRLWICYNPVFRRELRNAFLDYFEYSQQLRRRALHRFLASFQPR